MTTRQRNLELRLRPVVLAIGMLPLGLNAQVADGTTSADVVGRASAFDTGGQATVGPRPFTSFMERISSPVAKIAVKIPGDNLPADGVSETEVFVDLQGAGGLALKEDVDLTIEVDGGARIVLPGAVESEGKGRTGDIDKVQPGYQATAKSGQLKFKLVAPYKPGVVNVRVSVRGVAEKVAVRYVPDLREMIVVGLLEGRIRADKFDPKTIVPVRENDLFDQELKGFEREFNGGRGRAGARAAVYLKGKIKGEYLLTLAYDSDKETRRGLFQDIDPNAFYPVYGDSSVRGVDAQSTGKLYVRLDKNRSFLLFGDFTTQDNSPSRSLSQYSRSLPGLRGHYEEGKVIANAFLARESLRQIVDEFPGRGMSGPYSVSNPNGVAGTEKIEILVRDRNRPSIVLKSTLLTRSVDYEFEPFTGQILFKSPVPSFDDQQNPLSIRVTYEVEQGGEKFTVLGADLRLALTPTLSIGAAIAKDQNPEAPYEVSGVNVQLRLSKSTELIAEVARSTSVVNQGSSGFNSNTSAAFAGRSGEFSGNAARVELRHDDQAIRGRVYAVRAETDFNNPSAGVVGGKTELGASGAFKVNDKLTLNAEATRTDDRVAGSRSDAASVGADLRLSDRLTIGAGARRVSQDAISLISQGLVACNSGIGVSGSGYNSGFGINQQGNQQIDPLTGQPVVCTGSLLTGSTPAAPADLERTSLYGRVGFKVSDALMLNGELQREMGDNSTTLYRLGADWTVAKQTRIFARLEHSRAWGGAYGLGVGDAVSAFSVGVDTQYMQDGSLFTEYRLRDAANGREIQSALGLRNGWKLSEGLRLNTNFERSNGTSGTTNAIGLGLEYLGSELWKGSGRLEWRQDASNVNWLGTLSLARKLDRNWTLLARDYVNRVQPRVALAGDRFQNRFQVGFAYRPVDNNQFDALGMFERKIDTDRVARTDLSTDIVSLRFNYHPSRPWWISGRYAYKQVNELLLGTISDSYRAQLIGGRVSYDITNRWTLGALFTVLQGQGGARQHAYGLEVGYVLMDNLWATVGYNWRGFRDDDLTGSDYTNRGWVLGLRYKFDEDTFRRRDGSVNKTIEPTAAGTKP